MEMYLARTDTIHIEYVSSFGFCLSFTIAAISSAHKVSRDTAGRAVVAYIARLLQHTQ